MITVRKSSEVDGKGIESALLFTFPNGDVKKLYLNRDALNYSDAAGAAELLINCLGGFGSEAFDEVAEVGNIAINWQLMARTAYEKEDKFIERRKHLEQWFLFEN